MRIRCFLAWGVVVTTAGGIQPAATGAIGAQLRWPWAAVAFEELPIGSPARFVAQGAGYALEIGPTGVAFAMNPRLHSGSSRDGAARASVAPEYQRMNFVGANPDVQWRGVEELTGRANYFVGNDPIHWRTHVCRYAKVVAVGIYPGVDLVFYGNARQLEYDFTVVPGADPSCIRLQFQGLDRISVEGDGSLGLGVAGASLRLRPPKVYQRVDGGARAVGGTYQVDPRTKEVRFELGDYDRTQPLIIDPVLVYSSYLGGSGEDSAQGIALDGAGHVYVVGTTTSLNFPVSQGTPAKTGSDKDVFVAKFSADGSQLLYSTILGGTGDDSGLRIAVDASGTVAVMGSTASTNFPVVIPLQATNAGGTDIFVAQLDPTGSKLLFSSNCRPIGCRSAHVSPRKCAEV